MFIVLLYDDDAILGEIQRCIGFCMVSVDTVECPLKFGEWKLRVLTVNEDLFFDNGQRPTIGLCSPSTKM